MAWDGASNEASPVRDIEIAAVAPDMFDLTYYSIDSNFYDNYFKRITSGQLLQKIGYNWPVRSDFGSRFDGNTELEKFSVKDQIELVKTKVPQDLLNHDSILEHIVRDPLNLLTSWTAKDLLNYSQIPPDNYFGKCQKPLSEVEQNKRTPFPGDCVLGGRTGYSVKLISSDYLQSQLEMGGPTAGRSKLKNAPDPSW